MSATFITTALENGATLDDVQRAAGHAEPGTTKLYDRRGYNPEKSASFFATYLHIKDLRSQMGLAHSVFRTGEKADFERMLDDLLDRAKP